MAPKIGGNPGENNNNNNTKMLKSSYFLIHFKGLTIPLSEDY